MAKRMILLAAVMVVLAATLIGGATMAWFTDSDDAGDVTFTAGTLSVEAGVGMVYGIEQGTGDLYEIDVTTGKDYKLFDPSGQPAGDENYPNGLAFDQVNRRLYYADGGKLYFYSLVSDTETSAGTLGGTIAGATFGQGYYWYVPNGSDDLYRVKFAANGTFNPTTDKELVKQDFSAPSNINFGFGDLALKIHDGVIYGSNSDPSNNRVFFEIDMRNGYTYRTYTKIGAPNSGLQLAFAADGLLYGHTTHNDTGANWWTIELDRDETPSATFVPVDWIGEHHFTDLASNVQNNWNPGDTDHVRYVFENTGTKNQVIRFIPSFSWLQQGLGIGNVTVSLCPESEADWEKDGDYFYYIGPVLEPGDTATLCLNVHLSGLGTDDDYQGATLSLDGLVEAIQASNHAPLEVWGVNFYE